MGKLTAEERPKIGALVNEIRESGTSVIAERKVILEQKAIQEQLENESIDVTLRGRPVELGNHHPLTRVVEEIEDFFISMGYEIAEGPEVEKDYYNFEALNLPKGHPARD